jgi:uncharacterized membrane protein
VARTLTQKSYPLLKFLIPLAVLVFAVGLLLFFLHTGPVTDAQGRTSTGQDFDPTVLVPYLIVAAALAFGGLLYRRKERVTLIFPTDQLAGRSRQELEGVLKTLEEAKSKGEITPDRYAKARDRVLSEMKGGK